jgi:hypothetical protein
VLVFNHAFSFVALFSQTLTNNNLYSEMSTEMVLRNLRKELREVLKKLIKRFRKIPDIIAEWITLLRQKMVQEIGTTGELPGLKLRSFQNQICLLDQYSTEDHRYSERNVSRYLEDFKSDHYVLEYVPEAKICQARKEIFNSIEKCFVCQAGKR